MLLTTIISVKCWSRALSHWLHAINPNRTRISVLVVLQAQHRLTTAASTIQWMNTRRHTVRTLQWLGDDTEDSDACELCTGQLTNTITTISVITYSSSISSIHYQCATGPSTDSQVSSITAETRSPGHTYWVINSGRVKSGHESVCHDPVLEL